MICVVLPISRTQWLRPVFNSLSNLEKPNSTELIIITDGDAELERAVDRRLDQLHFFARIQVLSFGDSPAEDINSRRFRISAIHNKLRHYIPDDCKYVWSIEDDTTYPPHTLTQLKYDLELYGASYVEAVQLGRRNSPYLGCWKANNVHNPTEIKSLMPSQGLQEIDAGGLYCCLIDADLYKMHTFEPLDKQGWNGLSCDVNFGLYLRQQGYKCLIDWDLQTDHIGEHGSVNLGNTKPEELIFIKTNNEWVCRRAEIFNNQQDKRLQA